MRADALFFISDADLHCRSQKFIPFWKMAKTMFLKRIPPPLYFILRRGSDVQLTIFNIEGSFDSLTLIPQATVIIIEAKVLLQQSLVSLR